MHYCYEIPFHTLEDKAIYYCYLETPIGDLLLAGDGDVLFLIDFPEGAMRKEPEPGWIYSEKSFGDVREQLNAYFHGELQSFDLCLRSYGTEFQRKVLNELQEIPYGTTTSYSNIAKKIGKSNAARAVGAACGFNPIPIIIPCHRVIGSSGNLVGFGGGILIKKALLRHEIDYSQFPL
ncbi:methylated-DNA--[protein]-cysteine S-methyltransferase [Woeseiaceae bacterium]|nr:methylated-DNA--[protein]-cysteine S-methyltransferase [Woeseiaceae bacterium]